MDIRIITLKIQNFKGIQDLTLDFGGVSANVVGDNGLGKSTIFDAFTWLLFGKDHRNTVQNKFEIVPIDPATGEQVHHLETLVEAELSTDNVKTTLRRVWRETWSRAKKETESKLTGHESLFFVNGVNVDTLANYDEYIHGLIDEKIFRLITDPLFFIGENTDKKARRDTLFDLAGDAIDKSALRERFADIIAIMNGDDVVAFRKRIAADKRQTKKDLADCDPAIAAYTDSLPAPEDYAAIEKEIAARAEKRDADIAALKAQIAEVDGWIADIRKADAAAVEKTSGDRRKIGELQLKARVLVDDALSGISKDNYNRESAIRAATLKVEQLSRKVKDGETSAADIKQQVKDAAAERAKIEACVVDIRAKIEAVKTRAFAHEDETVCPACGQPLPPENIEQARKAALDKFTADNLAEIDRLKKSALSLQPRYDALGTDIENGNSRVVLIEAELGKTRAALEVAQKELKDATDVPVKETAGVESEIKASPEYKAIEAEIAALKETTETPATDVSGLLAQRKEHETKIDAVRKEYDDAVKPLEARLARHEEAARIKAKIDAKNEDKKRFTEHLAELEREEFDAAEYLRADIEATEGAINARFRLARFRMFDTLVNGDVVEDCTVLDTAGVPYGSMNDAKRILVGMDVIDTFCRAYGVNAPIFVDNAESITVSKFPVDSQVIRLSVVKGAKLAIEQ